MKDKELIRRLTIGMCHVQRHVLAAHRMINLEYVMPPASIQLEHAMTLLDALLGQVTPQNWPVPPGSEVLHLPLIPKQ